MCNANDCAHHREEQKEEFIEDVDNKYMTKYGQRLFRHFCRKRTWIIIRNFEVLPVTLREELFGSASRGIVLGPITKLFPNLTEITFNELDLQQMRTNSKQWTRMILYFVSEKYGDLESEGCKLEKIEFESKPQNVPKADKTLQVLVDKWFKRFLECEWKIVYKYRNEPNHKLVFLNDHDHALQHHARIQSKSVRFDPDIAAMSPVPDAVPDLVPIAAQPSGLLMKSASVPAPTTVARISSVMELYEPPSKVPPFAPIPAPIPPSIPIPNTTTTSPTVPAPIPFAATAPGHAALIPPMPVAPPMPRRGGGSDDDEDDDDLKYNGMDPAFSGRAPSKKMRMIAWTKLRGSRLKQSMFNDMAPSNEHEMKIDFDLLDQLWCQQKKIKKRKKRKKRKSKKQRQIRFLHRLGIRPSKPQLIRIVMKARKKTAKTPKDWRDMILTMELPLDGAEDPEDIVDALIDIVPTEENRRKFSEYMQSNGYTVKDVKRFADGERLWYFCRSIRFVSLRCKHWKFKLQFEEKVRFNLEQIHCLHAAERAISGNKKMQKVMELMLSIGNYLNSGRTMGRAQGIGLEVFDRFRAITANKATSDWEEELGAHPVPNMGTEKYTLLMFVVRTVNADYPELAEWTQILDGCKHCERIEIDLLEFDVARIAKQVHDLEVLLRRMDKGWIKMNDAPKDVYRDTMSEFVERARTESADLSEQFAETKMRCEELVGAMGEQLTDNYSLSDFWATLDSVRKHWTDALHKLEKIKNDKKRAQRKAELTAKAMKTVKRIKRRPPGQAIVIPIESGKVEKMIDLMEQKYQKQRRAEVGIFEEEAQEIQAMPSNDHAGKAEDGGK